MFLGKPQKKPPSSGGLATGMRPFDGAADITYETRGTCIPRQVFTYVLGVGVHTCDDQTVAPEVIVSVVTSVLITMPPPAISTYSEHGAW